MNIPKSPALILAFFSAALSSFAIILRAQETPPPVVVLQETGMPSKDSPEFARKQLERALPRARFASTEQLNSLLAEAATRLLVLPYGSAFPEGSWPVIHEFLQHGGNLLVLGGRPFTRTTYHNDSG